MEVQVRGKGVVITEGLRGYAEKRLQKLTNHFQNLRHATVTQTIQGQMHKVEVLLEGDGVKVRCEERGDDLYAAIDRISNKLERQLQKYKGRDKHKNHHHYGHHGEVVSPRTAPLEEDEGEPITGQIVRTKAFAIKPVSPEEAVLEMELLAHDFFVFENADTGKVNVLYRREDKNYGILEPEH